MSDILRHFEFCSLEGHSRRAERGKKHTTLRAYVDTGAGRTVVSEAVARRVELRALRRGLARRGCCGSGSSGAGVC